ncbi:MAG: efflux RND transporter periplasmic adaptor subunit [Robiginitomaculum sp.]|nr:efflux RND transporter periplasmic adaptor subunit [Robiginitomaculum sp.]
MSTHETPQTASAPAKRKSRNPALLLWRSIVFALPVLVIIGGVAGVMIMGALNPKPEKKAEELKPAPVLVTSPRLETVHLAVNTQGEVRPQTEIDIVPQISGEIVYVAPGFIDGGFFKKGDVLVRIEPADYKLRVIQAEAQVAQAEQRLAREQAESEIAKHDWAELGEGEASPLTLRLPQMAEAQAALDSANARLADAKLQLSRTVIHAPFTGRVRVRNADFGQYVTVGTRLGRIFATQVVEIRLPLTDTELSQLDLPLAFIESANMPGPKVDLSAVVAGKKRHWTGRITRTDSAIDPRTRVLFAFVEVDDPYGAGADDGMPLAVGLFVDAHVEGRAIPNALVVPRTALRGDNTVYLAKDDNTLSMRTVTVVSSNRNEAILIAGIGPDDRVITSPVRAAAEGLKIETVDHTTLAEAKVATINTSN